MTVTITCAHCGKQFQADPTGLTALAGKRRDDGTRPLEYRFTCTHCGKWTAAPAASIDDE